MDIAIVGAGTVGTAVGVAWAGAGHRIVAVAGRQETVSRARDVAAGRARAADRRGGVRRGARGDRRARRGAAGDRLDGGERGDPRRRRPASVRRQRARRARARRGGRRSATRRAPAADLRRRCGCARDAARLCRRGDGGRRRRVRARRGPRSRSRRAAVPSARCPAPPVSRGRGVRVELSGRRFRRRRSAVLACGRARGAGGDAAAPGSDARQRAPAGPASRAHRPRGARRRRDDRSEPLGDRRGRSGAGRAVRGAVPCRDGGRRRSRARHRRRPAIEEVLARWS